MHINIIAVGKLKEKYLTEGVGEYLKRLGPYAKVEITEMPDEKAPDNASPAEEEMARAKEAEKIKRHLKPGTFTVALAIEGKTMSSEELAARFTGWALAGKSDINFIIGGSLGLHHSILSEAAILLSFGPMTFPHQLMRLMLIEQIYRAFKINRGEPYHK
jgi:23S rRNA (pseudouridine1915-N3)-methyltransferase